MDRIPQDSPILCEHANEMPAGRCICPETCYCKRRPAHHDGMGPCYKPFSIQDVSRDIDSLAANLKNELPQTISHVIQKHFYLIPKGRVENIMFAFDGMESGAKLIQRLIEVAERRR